jgi:DNA polymerase III subunit delta'
MAFVDFPHQNEAVQLLQRSLERGRLGHAYLFVGDQLESLEAVARTLAKTLNCESPGTGKAKASPPDCCDRCPSCRKIDQGLHPDMTWLRPESKSRIIRVEQVRDLIRTVNLKPVQARFKVGLIAAADRLKEEAANAFLKTLEEPPASSVLILMTTDPTQILETILSRCLRLNFSAEAGGKRDEALQAWLAQFGETAAGEQGSLLSRYRLLSILLKKLTELRERIAQRLGEESPLERAEDPDPFLKEKWEDELAAAIEAEYRRQRAELLTGLQWWLRDVWLQALAPGQRSLAFPQLQNSSQAVARRISAAEGVENLRSLERTQWLLNSNIQEALALEVGLLKLKL